MATKEDFDRIREIGKRLKVIFARDGFQYESGSEEYVVRAVEEAAQHSVEPTLGRRWSYPGETIWRGRGRRPD